MSPRAASLGLIAVAALATPVAPAHHAFAGNYDLDLYGSIEGVVEEVAWTNPHVHYYVVVTTEDGTTGLWDVETMNISSLVRYGWSRDSIQFGDVVKISDNLAWGGRSRIWADLFEKDDGTVLYPRPAPAGDE